MLRVWRKPRYAASRNHLWPSRANRPKLTFMNDRDVYQTLAAVAEDLLRLSETAETYVGNAALRTAAQTLAGTAKAVYEHCLEGETH